MRMGRSFDDENTFGRTQLCGMWSDGGVRGVSYSFTNGLRPCISLKSDIIKITGGDGLSEATAYTIGL